MGRAPVTPIDNSIHCGPGAFEDSLHAPVLGVAYPARQPGGPGLPGGLLAEENALDTSRHQHVSPHSATGRTGGFFNVRHAPKLT